jgi:hypothetical protein
MPPVRSIVIIELFLTKKYNYSCYHGLPLTACFFSFIFPTRLSLQAKKYAAASIPIAGAVIGGVILGPVGVLIGLKVCIVTVLVGY